MLVDTFTERNHYNPCFWTALWNVDYFQQWKEGTANSWVARDQVVYSLNLLADRVHPTKASNVHFDKNLGLAEITPESMRAFCLRWRPDKHESLGEYVAKNPETLYLDFEDILTSVEEIASSSLMKAARIGGVDSAKHRGFLIIALLLHAMRSHDFMATLLEASGDPEIPKWERFWLLKGIWSDRLLMSRATVPLAMSHWTLYQSKNHCLSAAGLSCHDSSKQCHGSSISAVVS